MRGDSVVTATVRRAGTRRRALSIALGLVLGALILAGCGDPDTSEPPLASPSPSASSRGAVLVVVADVGFEDSEFAAAHDALVKAGYTPVVADSTGDEALGVGGARVVPDLTIGEARASDYLAVALIGGAGTKKLWDDEVLHQLARDAIAADLPVGAICAAPVILARADLLEGRAATVWRDYREELESAACSEVGSGVVVDGTLVTADGPDSAEEFAATLIEAIDDAQSATARPASGDSRD